MSLGAIFEGVQQILGDGVNCQIGPEFINANAAPPRVLFIPTSDRYGPPESAGDNPRQLLTRFAGCTLHIWGTDFTSTEILINSTLAAINQVVGTPNYVLDGEAGWAVRDGGFTSSGRLYIVHVAFKVPIVDVVVPTAKVTSVPLTATMTTGTPPVDEDAG